MSILSASEALYGFAAWLTTRDEEVIASAHHDSAIWADLVAEFCEVNSLPEPKDDWHTNLIHSTGEVSVAGRGINADQTAEEK